MDSSRRTLQRISGRISYNSKHKKAIAWYYRCEINIWRLTHTQRIRSWSLPLGDWWFSTNALIRFDNFLGFKLFALVAWVLALCISGELKHEFLLDVDSPCTGPSENGKGAKRPFIPKRLVIGNEEYVFLNTICFFHPTFWSLNRTL